MDFSYFRSNLEGTTKYGLISPRRSFASLGGRKKIDPILRFVPSSIFRRIAIDIPSNDLPRLEINKAIFRRLTVIGVFRFEQRDKIEPGKVFGSWNKFSTLLRLKTVRNGPLSPTAFHSYHNPARIGLVTK